MEIIAYYPPFSLCCLHSQDGIVLPVSVDLIPNLSAAKSAAVFVFVPFRKNKKEEFIDRHCLTAFRAVELDCLELIKA